MISPRPRKIDPSLAQPRLVSDLTLLCRRLNSVSFAFVGSMDSARKGTKAQRHEGGKKNLSFSFPSSFVPLCLCAFVFNSSLYFCLEEDPLEEVEDGDGHHRARRDRDNPRKENIF